MANKGPPPRLCGGERTSNGLERMCGKQPGRAEGSL